MASLTDLRTRVRYILGEPAAVFWSNTEVDAILVESIREVSHLVVIDAFFELKRREEKYFTGSAILTFDHPALHFLSLIVRESDDKMGCLWDKVSPDTFEDIRRTEGDLGLDSTTTRIWMPYVEQSIILYPIPAVNRYGIIDYIRKPSEYSTMTLPDFLHSIVIDRSIAVLASKKSRDLDMSDRYERRWRASIVDINRQWWNRYGLSSAKTDYIQSIM